MARQNKEPFADEPDLHYKETPKSRKCRHCGAALAKARWTPDPVYWSFAIYNCEKRRKK
jgi:hypothetical protein